MANRACLFSYAICGLILSACSGEEPASSSIKTESEITKQQTAKSATKTPAPQKAPSLNFCHNGEFNPKKPFNFVYFNLATNKNEMTRIRDAVKTQMAALKDLPPEAKAKAIEPHLGKSQVLAALGIQPLADQMQRISATLCNFSTYAKDKCTGLFSRSVTNAEIVEGSLSYTAPDAKGQSSKVTFSKPDYSDITIEAGNRTSHWARNADGVEKFSAIDPVTETRWTENPDCSGQFTQRRKNTSIEATWTSPITGAISIDYSYCSKDKCFDGTI